MQRYQRVCPNIYYVIYIQDICPHPQGRAEPSSGEPCLTWEVVEKKMAWGVVILIGDEDDDDDLGGGKEDGLGSESCSSLSVMMMILMIMTMTI